jgi:hypothetical protein
MKKIILLILTLIFLSCEKGRVEPDIIVDSKEDALKQEMRLKQRFENLHKSRRKIAEESLSKQVGRREFFDSTKELEHTNDAKIDYYLDKANNAYKTENEKDATRYANKVLELDPENVEAKGILRKLNALVIKEKNGMRAFVRENNPAFVRRQFKKDKEKALREQGKPK